MQLGLNALYAFLDACPTPSLVLATVIRTEGASYRKAGAMMLIDADLNTSGLVSGGCLEDDLKMHSESVFLKSAPVVIEYDLSQEEAASMWGLGLGCGGRIEVLLEHIDAGNRFGGLADLREPFFDGRACTLHKIIESVSDDPVGSFRVDTDSSGVPDIEGKPVVFDQSSHSAKLTEDQGSITLSIPVSPVKRLLVCGAGPDAIPLVELAASLSWQVLVTDPRAIYLKTEHFPHATLLLCDQPTNVDVASLGAIQAAVVMTHNVERDCTWLQKLYAQPIPYIGLLGPVARRDMLLERAGLGLESRLHGPAGLDIGAALPDEIALSIVAQMHAAMGQRSGAFLSAQLGSKKT